MGPHQLLTHQEIEIIVLGIMAQQQVGVLVGHLRVVLDVQVNDREGTGSLNPGIGGLADRPLEHLNAPGPVRINAE
ncbi:hypothetical protein ES703_117255 [subsurface metagenome]